jgi:broad specificity phosphatase PhoE
MSRIGGFANTDEPLDARGRKDASGFRPPKASDRFISSPALAAAETALAMGVSAQREESLADMDAGRWAGLSFADIHEKEPESLAAWLGDPANGAPDGETLPFAQERIGRWLDRLVHDDRGICAITHPMMIRAALIHMLGLTQSAALAIDLAPLCAVTLSYNRMWRLQSIVPNN